MFINWHCVWFSVYQITGNSITNSTINNMETSKEFDVLHDPRRNKRPAFSEEERINLGLLELLLPNAVESDYLPRPDIVSGYICLKKLQGNIVIGRFDF